MKYAPFGATIVGSVTTDKKFTGQRLDDTGLYYYNARYYDPTIGRFISADTVVQSPYNPQTLNRYSYCLNNPLKYTDPSGHVNVISDDGGWDAGTPIPIVIIPVIQSGGVGTGFGDVPEDNNEPDLPLDDSGSAVTKEPEPTYPKVPTTGEIQEIIQPELIFLDIISI